MDKNIKRLLEKDGAQIIATETGCLIKSNAVDILTLVAIIVEQLNQNLPKDIIMYAIEKGFNYEESFNEEKRNEVVEALRKVTEIMEDNAKESDSKEVKNLTKELRKKFEEIEKIHKKIKKGE